MAASSDHVEIRREFSRRLREILAKKGWSQSDLARRMYGDDDRGGAKKRYVIGTYVHGRSLPRSDVVKLMCKVLSVAEDELLPQGRPLASVEPLLSFEQIGPHTVRLSIVSHEMPLAKAMKIVAILNEPDK